VQKEAKRSGQAERSGEGCLGVSPDYGTTQHASAKKKAKRSRQAERRAQRSRGIRGFLPTTTIHFACTPKKAKPSAAARQSEAGKGGSGVSPGFDTTQHAHALKKAKRCGQAERSGEGGFGGLPQLRQSKSHARQRRPSRALRPGRALRKRGFGGLDYDTARPRA
jgi:hypothetical protein